MQPLERSVWLEGTFHIRCMSSTQRPWVGTMLNAFHYHRVVSHTTTTQHFCGMRVKDLFVNKNEFPSAEHISNHMLLSV